MKKLMFAAAAMAAGIAMADVTSANIVGYNTKQTAEVLYPTFGACFIPVNGAKTYQLGDIKAENTNWGNSYIMFLDKDGATEMIVDENLGTVDKAFYYVNPDEAAEWECDVGWYLMADEETLYPYNDLPLAAGEGFEFVCQDIGAILQMPAPVPAKK